MSRFDGPLNNLKVASPCSADWEQMFGDERKRFCDDCKLNVYNLSGMTRGDAESLIMNHEGRLCVRFFARADGTVITQDCPVGWEKVKRRTRRMATAMASLFATLFAGIFAVSVFTKRAEASRATVGELVPYATPTPKRTPPPTMGAIAPEDIRKDKKEQPMMGKIAVPQKING